MRPRTVTFARLALRVLLPVAVALGIGYVLYQRALGPRVAVVRPSRRPLVQTVVASGRVLPPAEVNLGSMLAGVVRAVHAREGERVAAGQLLVEFDDAELVAQVAQARAGVMQASARVGQLRQVGARVASESVRQAEANLRVAQSTLERQQALAQAGAVAPAELDNARRALDVARSQLDAAQAQAAGSAAGGSDARLASAGRLQAEAALRAAEARLAQARIRAPASGVILRRDVEPGDVVGAVRTLMVLLRDGATELTVAPDERNLAALRAGQPALASAEAFPERVFPAEVTYIAPAIDPQRGTVEVRLRVASPPEYLRPEMTVSVEIEVGRTADALTLPTDAVRDAGGRAPWVLVVGPDGRTARRDVRLGLRGERVVEVRAGLREGGRVVPAASVRAGQRVRPLSSRAVRARAARRCATAARARSRRPPRTGPAPCP